MKPGTPQSYLFIALSSVGLIAGQATKPKITIQTLGPKEIDDGAVSQAYYIQDPNGKSGEWHSNAVVISASHKIWGGLQIRVNGRLHHLTRLDAKLQHGPYKYRNATYQRFTAWSDNELNIEIYENCFR